MARTRTENRESPVVNRPIDQTTGDNPPSVALPPPGSRKPVMWRYRHPWTLRGESIPLALLDSRRKDSQTVNRLSHTKMAKPAAGRGRIPLLWSTQRPHPGRYQAETSPIPLLRQSTNLEVAAPPARVGLRQSGTLEVPPQPSNPATWKLPPQPGVLGFTNTATWKLPVQQNPPRLSGLRPSPT